MKYIWSYDFDILATCIERFCFYLSMPEIFTFELFVCCTRFFCTMTGTQMKRVVGVLGECTIQFFGERKRVRDRKISMLKFYSSSFSSLLIIVFVGSETGPLGDILSIISLLIWSKPSICQRTGII